MPKRIHVSLEHRAGPLHLDVQFTLEAPWTALFAPSGAGKTTILRMIAGLGRPQTGRVVLEPGETLLDTRKGIVIPAHLRKVRMVGQRPALFPHLSVMSNVLYGAPSLKPDEDLLAPDLRLEDILSLCRIAHLRGKMPSQLSGGERQRVAIARTLTAEDGRLLLLDEPFTGLEADLRDELIQDLRAWTQEREIQVLLVTHDLGEVFAAEAQVLKMEGGRIVAQGPTTTVLSEERDRLIERLHPRNSC